MWVKSEADRKMYNLDHAHTIEVLKKGDNFYVVAQFQGVGVNTPVNVGDAYVAQLSLARNEEDAQQLMGRVTRALGENVLNLDTAESRKKSGASTPTKTGPALQPMGGTVPVAVDGEAAETT